MDNLGNVPIRTSNDTGYEALKDGAALVDRSEKTMLRLTGKDPAGMLNAVLTNEVSKEPNLGAYAALLNPKGRIQTDLRVLKADEDILIDTEPEGAEAAREILAATPPSPASRSRISQPAAPWESSASTDLVPGSC